MIDHYRDVKFIVVPHEIDPDRIERLIGRIGRPALRYTQLTPETDSAEAGVLIVDTIGILSSLYRVRPLGLYRRRFRRGNTQHVGGGRIRPAAGVRAALREVSGSLRPDRVGRSREHRRRRATTRVVRPPVPRSRGDATCRRGMQDVCRVSSRSDSADRGRNLQITNY